jgi:hypothetical protein
MCIPFLSVSAFLNMKRFNHHSEKVNFIVLFTDTFCDAHSCECLIMDPCIQEALIASAFEIMSCK